MLIRVDPDLPTPVYEQIRAQVALTVASGKLVGGARLPTIRQLAADLGLAKGTVERSYELLESDGVVESRGRSGTFVIGTPPTDSRATAQVVKAEAEAFAVAAIQAGVSDQEALQAIVNALKKLRS